MQPLEVLAHPGIHGAPHQPVGGFQYGDFALQLTRRGGHFETYEAAADHHQPRAGLKRAPQGQRVFDAPQIMHDRQVCARYFQSAQRRTRREQQLVVRERAAIVQAQAMRFGIDLCDGRLQAQLDVVLDVPLGLEQMGLFRWHLSEQHRFGQRRALMRRVRFLAHNDDVAGEAALAHGARRLPAGLAGANNYMRLHKSPAGMSGVKRPATSV